MRSRYFKFKNIKISDFGEYILQSVTNIETGNSVKRKVEYIDTDGIEYKDIYYTERTFEISGHIKANNEIEMVTLKRKLIKACSLKKEFQLEYFNRKDRYIANCFFTTLPTFEKRKKWWLPFKLYLSIPSFFWQSYREFYPDLFIYKDTVKDKFTLPCVFTERIDGAVIYNHGDCETFPIFEIVNESEVSNSSILILNKTLGKKIFVNYSLSNGETVIIDTFNSTVTSNLNGNITPKISLDTVFFPFEIGKNEIECVSIGNLVRARYRERFLGV